MGWGPRVADSSVIQAEGDKLYVFGQWNDQSGLLQPYQPVYKDFSDAAEWNVQNSGTALTVGLTIAQVNAGQTNLGFPGQGPNLAQSVGRVVGSTNFNAGGASNGTPPLFVGIFNPENVTSRPSTGDVIRIQRLGATPVAISGGSVPKVGDYLIADSTQPFAITRPAVAAGGFQNGGQPSLGSAIFGRILATANQISYGATVTPASVTIPAGPMGGGGNGKYLLVNGWIDR